MRILLAWRMRAAPLRRTEEELVRVGELRVAEEHLVRVPLGHVEALGPADEEDGGAALRLGDLGHSHFGVRHFCGSAGPLLVVTETPADDLGGSDLVSGARCRVSC